MSEINVVAIFYPKAGKDEEVSVMPYHTIPWSPFLGLDWIEYDSIQG